MTNNFQSPMANRQSVSSFEFTTRKLTTHNSMKIGDWKLEV
jgi:hypothetical protein